MNRELFQLKHSWTICLACVIRCPSGYKASPCSIVPVTEQGLLRPHHFITECCMLEQPQRATASQLWQNQDKNQLVSNGRDWEFLPRKCLLKQGHGGMVFPSSHSSLPTGASTSGKHSGCKTHCCFSQLLGMFPSGLSVSPLLSGVSTRQFPPLHTPRLQGSSVPGSP